MLEDCASIMGIALWAKGTWPQVAVMTGSSGDGMSVQCPILTV
jgi:hypothetical protein